MFSISENVPGKAPGDFEEDPWLKLLCGTESEYLAWKYMPKLKFDKVDLPSTGDIIKMAEKRIDKEQHEEHDHAEPIEHWSSAEICSMQLARDKALEVRGITFFDFDWKFIYSKEDLLQFMLCISSRCIDFYVGVTTDPAMRMAGPRMAVAHRHGKIPVHKDRFDIMTVLCARRPRRLAELEKHLIEYARTTPEVTQKCQNKIGGGGHINRFVRIWYLYIVYNLDSKAL